MSTGESRKLQRPRQAGQDERKLKLRVKKWVKGSCEVRWISRNDRTRKVRARDNWNESKWQRDACLRPTSTVRGRLWNMTILELNYYILYRHLSEFY